MKFKSYLNYFENKRAWHYFRIGNGWRETDYKSLTSEEHSQLMALNEQLKTLEAQYFPILTAKGNELQARAAGFDDWMQEFNLEIVFTFYLREDDPEYEEDDDNILMQIDEWVLHKNNDWGWGMTHVNHCHFPDYFKSEHHCYLYHNLYDHCNLDWRDLLRIGEIFVEIKIEEQSKRLPVAPRRAS